MRVNEFGPRLRELRQRAGLSQRELADKVSVNFTYLSKIESGAMPPPSQKIILKLAEVLKADPDELITLAGKIPADIAQMLKNPKVLKSLRSGSSRNKITSSVKERVTIMKNLVNYQSLSRVAIPIVLVIAIAASLWFAAPTPVRAVDITVTDTSGNTPLPSGTLGSEYTFKVKVDIQNMDLLPVQRVDVQIYNASDSSKKATLENLPLQTVSKQTQTISEGASSGSASVAASTATGWGPGNSGSRQGYGYGYSTGWGYISMTQTFGYGYGYSAYQGTTSITYTVYWTPPGSSAWAGTYKIKPIVYGDDATLSKAFTVSSIPSFTVSVAAGAGGIPPLTTSAGVFTQQVVKTSADANVALVINAGTVGKTKEGLPITEINILPMATPPTPPADSQVIGLAYDLGPAGATFDPPITLTFTYDPTLLPAGVEEKNLVIAWWDGANWVNLVSTVDPTTHTITAKVSHFTPFTVIVSTRPAVFTLRALTISPAEVNTREPATISVIVANTGDLTGKYKVTLKVNNVVTTKEVTLAGGTSQTVTFTTVQETAGTYSVTVDSLSGSLQVRQPATPASFTISTLTISPTEVNIGEEVTISILVANTGELSGSYTVALKVNNVVIATKEVTLAGGTSQTVTFTTSRDAAGTYTVNLNGLSGTLVVKAPAAPPPAEPVNWLLIGAIIAGAIIVIVVVVVIWLMVRRRRF